MQPLVILLTGATSMIGKALSETLSKSSDHLILASRSKQKLKNLYSSIKSPTPFEIYELDICDETAINQMVSSIIKKHNRLDVLIHNTAIYPWKKIEDLSLKSWQDTLNATLTSAFLLTKACIPHMKKQNFGKVVYLSSIAGEHIGLPFMSAYSASKAGLNGFMRTAAIELAPFNINVNSISPGKIYDEKILNEQ